MSGRLAVVGLGPGDERYLTPEAAAALADAQALYGYGPYLDRVPARAGQSRHPSDNREEAARAAEALDQTAQGVSVAVVSGGDPGVFAMAAAICEQIATGPDTWRTLDVVFIPGVTAMLAVAGRLAPARGAGFLAVGVYGKKKPVPPVGRRAGSRFLRGVVVRQSQAVAADRAPARCSGASRLCHRALQSGVTRAALAIRQRRRAVAPPPAADDAGHIRPRRRAARRAGYSDDIGKRRE